MSEDEVESFEITDYDLDNEFNINRPRRKLSKKQQMLGTCFILLSIPLFQSDSINNYVLRVILTELKANQKYAYFRYLGR